MIAGAISGSSKGRCTGAKVVVLGQDTKLKTALRTNRENSFRAEHLLPAFARRYRVSTNMSAVLCSGSFAIWFGAASKNDCFSNFLRLPCCITVSLLSAQRVSGRFARDIPH